MIHQLAIVFPGQGSQAIGMLADLSVQFKEVKQTFAEASSALKYDLWDIVQNGPADTLNSTIHAQPAVLAASYAIWQILQNRIALQPIFFAGHSLGEYTALVCGEALQFTDAIKLVATRGKCMQEAVPIGMGAMAAIIGLDDNTVIEICKAAIETSDEILTPANFNSIGQVVIAGHKNAILRAIALAKEKGAKMAVILPVSVPSHCKLMLPAALCFKDALDAVSFKQPKIPVLNNVDVAYYKDPENIREGLLRQLYLPVRWVETIQQFVKEGITNIIECGPGKILTGLNKKIDKNLHFMTAGDSVSMNALLQSEQYWSKNGSAN